MLNIVVLIGRLTDDPDLRYTDKGTPVANFTMAVEEDFIKKDGGKNVEFIKIVTWNKLAKTCANNLKKGRLVAVYGKLKIKKNETEEQTYINPEVVAEKVRFLDWPKREEDGENNNEEE